MTSQQLGKTAALIMTIGLVCLGCSSDSDDASTSPAATPDTTMSTEAEIAPASSLADLVKQSESVGALNAVVDMTYKEGTGNFSSDVDPTDKEAVITFVPAKTWSAYFASDASSVFTGTYMASLGESSEQLKIEIVHEGSSADGKDNLITLSPDGTFTETSIGGPGKASGTYEITSPTPATS